MEVSPRQQAGQLHLRHHRQRRDGARGRYVRRRASRSSRKTGWTSPTLAASNRKVGDGPAAHMTSRATKSVGHRREACGGTPIYGGIEPSLSLSLVFVWRRAHDRRQGRCTFVVSAKGELELGGGAGGGGHPANILLLQLCCFPRRWSCEHALQVALVHTDK
jgi:hypothetical protein